MAFVIERHFFVFFLVRRLVLVVDFIEFMLSFNFFTGKHKKGVMLFIVGKSYPLMMRLNIFT